MVFEVFLDREDRYRWQLRDHGGKLIALAAEAHDDLDEAMRSLAAVRDSDRAEIRALQD